MTRADQIPLAPPALCEQCDMRVEAAHLERFYSNFAGVASQVRVLVVSKRP